LPKWHTNKLEKDYTDDAPKDCSSDGDIDGASKHGNNLLH